MRTDATYKEMVKKYKFSLSLLNQIYPKIYKLMLQTAELLNKHGGHYSDMIRNLRIDYAKSNDDKLAEMPRAIKINRGLYDEVFSMSYSPENNYTLGFMYIKNAVVPKRIFVEIIPNSLGDYDNFTIDTVFRVSKLNKNNQATKVFEYYAGYTDETLELFEIDLDKPKQIKNLLSIDKDCIDQISLGAEITF